MMMQHLVYLSETRLLEKAVHCLCQCHHGTLKDLGLQLILFSSSRATIVQYAFLSL